jgi:hypothetical protein
MTSAPEQAQPRCYSPHLAVTFNTVAVADPIAVHQSTMLFVRSFGGITISPPGSHVQMIPLPPDDAIAACRRNVPGSSALHPSR